MDLFRFISLIDTQARMSLKAEASKFILSYLWWIIEPLLYIFTFYIVFEYLLGRGGPNFIIFLFCGKIPFQWFSKSVTSASLSIVQNRGLISSISMPKIIFPYASVQEALYKQTAVFFVLFGVLILAGYPPELKWFWLIPLLIVQFELILLCSIIGALFVSFVRDVKMVINMLMLFLLFSSGVFWDLSRIPIKKREILTIFNPLAFILDAYRQVLMHSNVYNLHHLTILFSFLTAALILLHFLMQKIDKIITMKVLNS